MGLGLGRGDEDIGTRAQELGIRERETRDSRDVKLLGCGDAKYGKWESHVKYGTRPQAKYRT